MTTVTEPKRPTVIPIVVLCIIAGILNVQRALEVMSLMSAIVGYDVPTMVRLTTYLTLALGAFDVIAAVLILMYKQMGLQLAAIAFGLGLLINLYNVLAVENTWQQDVGIVVQIGVLVYAYIFLTRSPEKTFFN